MNGALNRASRTTPTGFQGESSSDASSCRPRLSRSLALPQPENFRAAASCSATVRRCTRESVGTGRVSRSRPSGMTKATE